MPSLMDIPGYGGWIQRNQQNQGAESTDLQQAGALQGIVAKSRAAQEEQQLKGMLAQSGGDPAKAIEVLMKAGTPKAMELAAKIKSLAPKPAEPYTLRKDEVRMDAKNQPIAFGVPAPETVKAPPMRTRYDGANAVQEEFQADGSWKKVGGGPRFQDRPERATPERVIPSPIVKAYTENSTALRKLDSALAEVDKYPDAFGLQNMRGDAISQRVDPKGVTARALIADIGSLKIHDRSGAAVTAAETPRLLPFIPNVNDNPATIKKKLGLFKKEYEAIQSDMGSIYSPEQGYKPLPGQAVAASEAIYATNGTQRLMSTDGGKTWKPAPAK
jgi:hypothetical protein